LKSARRRASAARFVSRSSRSSGPPQEEVIRSASGLLRVDFGSRLSRT
jgi:hypothetical protein